MAQHLEGSAPPLDRVWLHIGAAYPFGWSWHGFSVVCLAIGPRLALHRCCRSIWLATVQRLDSHCHLAALGSTTVRATHLVGNSAALGSALRSGRAWLYIGAADPFGWQWCSDWSSTANRPRLALQRRGLPIWSATVQCAWFCLAIGPRLALNRRELPIWLVIAQRLGLYCRQAALGFTSARPIHLVGHSAVLGLALPSGCAWLYNGAADPFGWPQRSAWTRAAIWPCLVLQRRGRSIWSAFAQRICTALGFGSTAGPFGWQRCSTFGFCLVIGLRLALHRRKLPSWLAMAQCMVSHCHLAALGLTMARPIHVAGNNTGQGLAGYGGSFDSVGCTGYLDGGTNQQEAFRGYRKCEEECTGSVAVIIQRCFAQISNPPGEEKEVTNVSRWY
jgi:hypothetical protein